MDRKEGMVWRNSTYAQPPYFGEQSTMYSSVDVGLQRWVWASVINGGLDFTMKKEFVNYKSPWYYQGKSTQCVYICNWS